ncbi:hypothetical protein HZA99_01210 [Candidatus Woesearchaeota archaeon]|nr:hypothetical protein [Candidatus Woesearchaeota archaeon]
MRKYMYVDTCIWLNLFKKEGDATKEIPYWKIAEEFFAQARRTQEIKVFVSTIVFRELSYKLLNFKL